MVECVGKLDSACPAMGEKGLIWVAHATWVQFGAGVGPSSRSHAVRLRGASLGIGCGGFAFGRAEALRFRSRVVLGCLCVGEAVVCFRKRYPTLPHD